MLIDYNNPVLYLYYPRCKQDNMAGMGRGCGHVSYANSSCIANGRIDVFPANMTSSCEFREGLTSGVLCCKKSKRRKSEFLFYQYDTMIPQLSFLHNLSLATKYSEVIVTCLWSCNISKKYAAFFLKYILVAILHSLLSEFAWFTY